MSSSLDSPIEDAISAITAAGYTGSNWIFAGHSAGGMIGQEYVESSGSFIASILMGAAINRDNVSINDDGTSAINYTVPTLTIGGTRDGVTRISRMAEARYHQNLNIQDSQAGLFPIELLDGAAHYQFASEDDIPKDVKKSDLVGVGDTAGVWEETAIVMTHYLQAILSGETYTARDETNTLLEPMVEAMEQEGYYNILPPCNGNPLVNPDSVTCMKGTPWVNDHLLETWFPTPLSWNSLITITNNDNTHPASEVFPYHHPETDGTCDASTTEACSIEHISNTQVNWPSFNDKKIQKNQLSAKEVMTKIKSRQWISIQAGLTDADFETLDEQNDECAMINTVILEWASERASTDALTTYQSYGQQLIMGEDKESINGGAWIYDSMKWKGDDDANTMTIVSKTVVTDESELVSIFKSMHYCKLLSTFRAMEWIYVDSLYNTLGLNTVSSAVVQEQDYVE